MTLDHPLLQDLNLLDILTISLFFFLGATFAAMYFQRKISLLKKKYRALYESAELDALENQDKEKENFVDQLQREREFHERRYAELQASKNHMRDQFKAVTIEEIPDPPRELQPQNTQNKERLELILTPLKERLEQLNAAVSNNKLSEERNRVFIEEISRKLIEKSDEIDSDADELARTLKGSSQQQGDGAEMILANILSYAGLTEGEEYSEQPSYPNARGEQLRPDLVLHFPQGQSLILDSKVELTAYSRLASTSDERERAHHLKQHLISVRTHIKRLAEKNYPEVVPQAFNDVLLFIPSEDAYIEALQAAPELMEESQRHNVLLTSPSNLLMSIKLCYYLGQRDRQGKRLEQIALNCTDIYHKFVSFMGLFIQLDKSLDKAKEKYDEAYRHLASGHSNDTRSIDQQQQLGVTPNKQQPEGVEITAEEISTSPDDHAPTRERRPVTKVSLNPAIAAQLERSRREVANALGDRRLPRNEIVAERERYERHNAQQATPTPTPTPTPQPEVQLPPKESSPTQPEAQIHATENISPERERREILEKLIADNTRQSSPPAQEIPPRTEPHRTEPHRNTSLTPTASTPPMHRETSAENDRRARLDSRMAEVDRRFMRPATPSGAPSSVPAPHPPTETARAYPSRRESLVAEAERRYYRDRDRGATASHDQVKSAGYHDFE